METHFPTMEGEPANREKLAADLKVVANDIEEIMKSTAGDVGEKATELRAKLSKALENAKAVAHRVEDKAIAGAKAADKVIRTHPYESIGVAFGVGLLIGVLINRK